MFSEGVDIGWIREPSKMALRVARKEIDYQAQN